MRKVINKAAKNDEVSVLREMNVIWPTPYDSLFVRWYAWEQSVDWSGHDEQTARKRHKRYMRKHGWDFDEFESIAKTQ